MLTTSLVQTQSPSLLFSSSSTCLLSCTIGSNTSLPIIRTRKGSRRSRIRCSSDAEAAQKVIQQSVLSATKSPTTVKAVVTVKVTIGGMFSHTGITRGLDDIGDLLGRTLLLELVSAELDERRVVAAKLKSGFNRTGRMASYELRRQLKIDAQMQFISQIPESLKENPIERLRSFSQGKKHLLDD